MVSWGRMGKICGALDEGREGLPSELLHETKRTLCTIAFSALNSSHYKATLIEAYLPPCCFCRLLALRASSLFQSPMATTIRSQSRDRIRACGIIPGDLYLGMVEHRYAQRRKEAIDQG